MSRKTAKKAVRKKLTPTERVRAQVEREMRRALWAWIVGTTELMDLYRDIGQTRMAGALRSAIRRVEKAESRT